MIKEEITRDLLLLVGYNVPIEFLKTLPTVDLNRAEKWAGKLHLKASDNNVRVPEKPAWLKDEWKVNYATTF